MFGVDTESPRLELVGTCLRHTHRISVCLVARRIPKQVVEGNWFEVIGGRRENGLKTVTGGLCRVCAVSLPDWVPRDHPESAIGDNG